MGCGGAFAGSLVIRLAPSPRAAAAYTPVFQQEVPEPRQSHAVANLEWRNIGPTIMGGRVADLAVAEALLHGSGLRTDPPSPGWKSRHFVTVRHSETGHSVEDQGCMIWDRQLNIEHLC